MHTSTLSPEEWIEAEDRRQRAARLARLEWVREKMPKGDRMVAGCGPISNYQLEEAQYCYVYGQFLAAIVLGLAFVESSLAGAFFCVGQKRLSNGKLCEIEKEGLKRGWLSEQDQTTLERIRNLRNPVTHFREPGDEERIETRACREQTDESAVIESDAREVLQAVFHLLPKITPGAHSG
ncbi:MAG: hypothetical protein B9S33_20505 [Pedosphaera sp. Tous-C6FEB]|nr:MAG: hypothetical protein B9S33_20505 [Pedosphaera sp. Tous-C6FEB]